MWKRIGPLLIVLSVAMNVAFIGVWATHAIGSHWPVERADDHGKVWCPLHRRLNVTDEQWRKIEPRMVEFRQASKALCNIGMASSRFTRAFSPSPIMGRRIAPKPNCDTLCPVWPSWR